MIGFAYAMIAITAAILQTTWLAPMEIGGGRPDLVLIVIVFYAHHHGIRRGEVMAFSVGLIEDLLSIAPLGFTALVRLAVAFTAGLTHDTMHADAFVSPILLVVIGSAAKLLSIRLVARYVSYTNLVTPVFSMVSATQIGLSLLFAIPIFAALNLLHDALQPERRGFS